MHREQSERIRESAIERVNGSGYGMGFIGWVPRAEDLIGWVEDPELARSDFDEQNGG
jgi:hypothetical protein